MEIHPADAPVLDQFTTLNYLKWNDLYRTETAFQTSVPLPSSAPDQRRHNLDFQPGEKQLIRDLRGCDEKPEIDVHGFQFFKQKTDLKPEQYYDAEAIRDVYLPEFVRMLREKIDGADHIFVYDWRVRNLLPDLIRATSIDRYVAPCRSEGIESWTSVELQRPIEDCGPHAPGPRRYAAPKVRWLSCQEFLTDASVQTAPTPECCVVLNAMLAKTAGNSCAAAFA